MHRENTDMVARRLDAQQREAHCLPEAASLSQRSDAEFVAHVANDRVCWFAVTHV
jgi:hypothetical protein